MSLCVICKQDNSVFALDHKHKFAQKETLSTLQEEYTLEEKIEALSRVLKAKRTHMRTRSERNDDWMYSARCPGCDEEKLLRIDKPICHKCEIYAYVKEADCQCDLCRMLEKHSVKEEGK